MTRFELTRASIVGAALRSRWPQFIVTALALAGFVFAILTGLTGTQVGSRNFGIVFTWIAWWALLMLIAVPLLGRGWCSICPLPAPGEWLQRGAILGPSGRGLGLGRRWPNKLRSIWLQNGAFALAALFSLVILTQPRATAIVLAAFLFIALGTSLVFERRAFCRYLCPLGGFIGLYSQLAPVEVRVKDAAVCAAHTEKTCYTGSAEGYGCPWQVFPGALTKNTYCGACVECLRTCPVDNVAVNLRPFGADLHHPAGRRLDEAFKAFLMLGSALTYAAVMLGPWGALKSAAYAVGAAQWWAYAALFLAFNFGILPGLFWITVRGGQWLAGRTTRTLPLRGSPSASLRVNSATEAIFSRSAQIASPPPAARNDTLNTRKAFIALAYSLVPLGLAAWIAFSLSFVFANFAYVWPALSDPLGWGWNLFGTAAAGWRPYFMRLVPAAQVVVLVGGLTWAGATARRIAGEHSSGRAAQRLALPVIVFCLLITLGLLGLLVA